MEAKSKVGKPPRSLTKWTVALAVLGGALLGIGAIYAISRTSSSQQASDRSQPASEQPVSAVSALGRLEPEGEVVKVASPSALGSSRIAKLLIKEGDMVRAGQVIAILDSYDRSIAALKQAEAKVLESESNLARVKAGAKTGDIEAQRSAFMAKKANVGRLETELSMANSDLRRYEVLYADGAATAIARDGYKLKVESLNKQLQQAKEEIAQAEALLNSVSEVRPTDIKVAEAQLESAEADVKRARIDVDLSQVPAPVTGQILKIHTKAGESVGTNGVVEMGNTRQMYAVAEVYETDIGKVKVGQKATITSEVFDGEISGTVSRIGLRVAKNDVLGTDPAAKTDVRVIEVRIRLDDSNKVSGLTYMQVKVKINI